MCGLLHRAGTVLCGHHLTVRLGFFTVCNLGLWRRTLYVVNTPLRADQQVALAPPSLCLANPSGLMSQTALVLIKSTSQVLTFFHSSPEAGDSLWKTQKWKKKQKLEDLEEPQERTSNSYFRLQKGPACKVLGGHLPPQWVMESMCRISSSFTHSDSNETKLERGG